MSYCIYLRKSRADEEAEQRGEGETLARHEKALKELAKTNRYTLDAIYKELVSGETISARPVMQQLLTEVEQGLWQGVLVMEVERLARGDTIDQGLVAQAFKYTNTKIITPMKTYDPNNEYDEEYFEFGLFMSRREYKTINRRLQTGRIASMKEGKYVGNKAPFGYERVKLSNEKGFTLQIKDEEAKIVQLMFEMYTKGIFKEDGTFEKVGGTKISDYLNERGIKTATNGNWNVQSISNILRNPVYIGKIKWGSRGQVKKIVNGEVVKSRPRKPIEDTLLVDGLHEPIISSEQWQLAQDIMKSNTMHRTPVSYMVANPLAGILVCKVCNSKMVRKPSKNGYPDTIMCKNRDCECASSSLCLVEDAIIAALKQELKHFVCHATHAPLSPLVQSTSNADFIERNNKDIQKLVTQTNSLHDLLEQGIYDTDTFLKRYTLLQSKIDALENSNIVLLGTAKRENESHPQSNKTKPSVDTILDIYSALTTAESKNMLLKALLSKVEYYKKTGGRWKVAPDEFTIKLYLKL